LPYSLLSGIASRPHAPPAPETHRSRQAGGIAPPGYLTVAIRNYHDSGNTFDMRGCKAELVALFDRLGCYEPAATIAGFAVSRLTAAAFPEITNAIAHLREVLEDLAYEPLARKGETMSTAATARYALDQIDHG
jgi:hypothetical protein